MCEATGVKTPTATGVEGKRRTCHPQQLYLPRDMNKAKKKAANRRLKRLIARYNKARELRLVPRYQRDLLIREREVMF